MHVLDTSFSLGTLVAKDTQFQNMTVHAFSVFLLGSLQSQIHVGTSLPNTSTRRFWTPLLSPSADYQQIRPPRQRV